MFLVSSFYSFIDNSLFFGLFISILAYILGVFLQKKLKLALFNPLLLSIMAVIIFLSIFKIDYASYEKSAKYLNYLLTPATIALAVPLYEKLQLLKKHFKAIILGITSGVITSMLSVYVFSLLFNYTHEQYVTLLPKSITTSIGMELSKQLNGYETITVAVIIITGIIGNMLGTMLFKLFHINNPIARGLALGTSSHAIGTARAMELGEVEGAMSSLSIALSGILTVILINVFQLFI